MELKELIHPLEVLEVVGNADVEISGIQSDSRKVEKGFLFVAVRGTASFLNSKKEVHISRLYYKILKEKLREMR